MSSLLRMVQHKAIKEVELSGSVIDLGGDTSSLYRGLFKGDFILKTLNNSHDANPDILHDLEKPLPFENKSYDGVLLINVLEHIYNFQQLLSESARILTDTGKIVIAVPFLFPIHPSPHDYWRFTDEALSRVLTDVGFRDIDITVLGGGVFSVRTLLIQRLLPSYVRGLYNFIFIPLAKLFDVLFVFLAKILQKKYNTKDYALGFLITAKKYGK